MTEANPNPNPDPGAPPPGGTPPPDTKALEAKARQLLDEKKKTDAENKALRERLADFDATKAKLDKLSGLAKELGVDLNQQDPEKLREQRAAEERARSAREQKIRDGVMFGLLESGRKLPATVARGIITGALSDPSITVGDDGTPVGVAEYLNGWLSTLAPSSDGKGTPPGPPSPPPGGSRSGGDQATPAKFANVKTYAELIALGPAAVAECHEKAPALYETLRRDQIAGAANPQRVIPAAALKG